MQSFENILNEKIADLTRLDEGPSSIRYSMTKQGSEYTGILLVNSAKGNFFATAVAKGLNDTTVSLMKEIKRQMAQLPLTAESFSTAS
jgi:hypothetical protein